MKPYRSKPIKTEQSPQRHLDINKKKNNCIFHSVLKNKRKSPTPRRFADVIKNKQKLESTNDNKDSSNSKDSNIMKSSIVNAISKPLFIKDVLKQNATQFMEAQAKSITPFSIQEQPQAFQQELSFKGANNRFLLLAKVKDIQQEADRIFQVVKNINKNSSIDFITFKLLREKQKDIRLSYYDFYSHLTTLTNKINHFVVELDRCRTILNQLSTGISRKTMQFYTDKFQNLIVELTNNVKHLQSYIFGLKRHQKQQKKALKKYIMGRNVR